MAIKIEKTPVAISVEHIKGPNEATSGEPTSHTLTMQAGTGGTTQPAIGAHTYPTQTTVPINATVPSGSRWHRWNLNGAYNAVQFTFIKLTTNVLAIAEYIKQWSLTTSASGAGTVTPASGTYDEGTITITATPTDPETTELDRIEFIQNGETTTVYTSPYELEFNVGTVLTAFFQAILQNFTVTISKTGNGTVTPDVGEHIYLEGTEVAVTATETNPDYYLDSIYDSATPVANPYVFNIAGNKSIEVRFLNIEQLPLLNDGNTVGWYKLGNNDIVDSGTGLVERWVDSSSFSNDMLQSNNTKKPNKINNGIRIIASAQGIETPIIFSSQPVSVYILIRLIQWVNGLRVIRPKNANSVSTGTLYEWGTTPGLAVHTGSGVLGENPDLPLGDWGVVHYVVNGASSKLKINKNTPTTFSTNTSVITGIAIGTPDSVTSSATNCEVKEMILRKINDTSENENLIIDYLLRRKNYLLPKMVSIGDSITAQNKWQPTLSTAKNYDYLSTESTNGIGLYPRMGVGGAVVVPYYTGAAGRTIGDSIYERADYVDNYYPTQIFLFGGTNDCYDETIPIGTISDEVYTGGPVNSNPPSFYASYKGTIEKLIAQNSNARIICLTPYYTINVNEVRKQAIVTAILECATLYNLIGLDLLTNSGINSGNYATYLSDAVHLNNAGGVLVGNYIVANT